MHREGTPENAAFTPLEGLAKRRKKSAEGVDVNRWEGLTTRNGGWLRRSP